MAADEAGSAGNENALRHCGSAFQIQSWLRLRELEEQCEEEPDQDQIPAEHDPARTPAREQVEVPPVVDVERQEQGADGRGQCERPDPAEREWNGERNPDHVLRREDLSERDESNYDR